MVSPIKVGSLNGQYPKLQNDRVMKSDLKVMRSDDKKQMHAPAQQTSSSNPPGQQSQTRRPEPPETSNSNNYQPATNE